MRGGNKIFSEYGIYDRAYLKWRTDKDTVRRYKEGMTGMPLIDALMRELLATGFLPHYGRMITSSYFVVDLKQDWRFGAAHYEEHLLDHDVHANIANWARVAAIAGHFYPFNS